MAKQTVSLRAILAIVLVMSILAGIIGCAPVNTTQEKPTKQQGDSVQLDSGLTVDSNTDKDTLSRDEKEQVAEVLGGTDNAGDLSDEELDDLVDDLIADLEPSRDVTSDVYDENGAMTDPFDVVYPELIENGTVTYDNETLLIKLRNTLCGAITEGMASAGVAALEMVVPMEETSWYEAKLIDGTDAAACLAALRELKEVVLAEYNYEIKTAQLDGYKEFDDHHDFDKNGHHKKQWYMHHCGIPDGMNEMTTNGGSASVVVAVIDSGVDYDHEDLAQNIWVNEAEIPDNGVDDDNNGYIDDYYGVNIITRNGNGDDDNGHGTHVAGIIAAQDNNLGVVGIAYNVKIMPVKAAMASGTLNQSDIAKAVLYAYEMGAEVINMSFGGSACSIAVQDALAVAYTRCVLVASAGNDGMPNEATDHYPSQPNYPAALTYVLGVMSVDQNGVESNFTNWDPYPFNGVEYELYAPGEAMMSTLPNNGYGTLSGTSMAAPVVAAMAAILRSEFADRDMYPTKFIYGQLCSTSGYTATCLNPERHAVNGEAHNLPQIVDLYSALTKLPQPDVNLQDFALFDTEDIAEGNSGDGVIDAGELISLGVTLRNRWGMSENTIVTIDALSNSGIADPYVTILNPSVDYGSVGTYSTQNAGAIYTDELLTAWEHPVYIQIAEDCPNDYRIKLNVTITCSNALDPEDTKVYESEGEIWLTVRSGVVLPSIIEEDMVLTPDNLYIIPNATVIEEGVTVRVEPGTHIQFWSDDPQDPYGDSYIAYLLVKGNFLVEGTKEEPVYIYPSDLMAYYGIEISETGNGYVSMVWADVTNLCVGANNTGTNNQISYVERCTFRYASGTNLYYRNLEDGIVYSNGSNSVTMAHFGTVKDSVFYKIGLTGGSYSHGYVEIFGNAERCIFVDCGLRLVDYYFNAKDCVFLGNDFMDQTVGDHESSSLKMDDFGSLSESYFTVKYVAKTGTTYVSYCDYRDSSSRFSADEMAAYLEKAFGGGYAVFKTKEELMDAGFGSAQFKAGIYKGMNGAYLWSDGTPISEDFYPVVSESNDDICINKGKINDGVYCYYSLYEIPGQVLVEEITFREYSVLMDMETTYQLSPLSVPLQYAADQFLYESSDENVVTVDEKGLVTPVGTGIADVTVYSIDRAVYNHVTIEVREYIALENLSFASENILLAVGENANVGCILSPVDTTRRNVVYTSSNEDVVTVGAGGFLTGVGNGTATITAQCEGMTVELEVTVYTKTTTLDIQVPSIVGIAPSEIALPNISFDEGATVDLVWEVLDPNVATVYENRAIVAERPGFTRLIVTDKRTGLSDSVALYLTEEQLPAVTEFIGDYILFDNGDLYYIGSYHSYTEPTLLYSNVACFQPLYGDGRYVIAALRNGTIKRLYIYNGVLHSEYDLGAFDDVIAVTGYCNSWSFNYAVVRADGTVYTWGQENDYGQLGLGVTSDVSEPTRVAFNEKIVNAYMNSYFTSFLSESGNLYVSGGSTAKHSTPMVIARNVNSVSFGGNYYVADCTHMYINSVTLDLTSRVKINAYDRVYMYSDTHYGIGIRDGVVYRFSGTSETAIFEGIENITTIRVMYANSYGHQCMVATSDGLLYAQGDNSTQGNNTFWGVVPKEFDTPILLPVIQAEQPADLLETNLTNGVLTEDTLEIKLNQDIIKASVDLTENGTGYSSILTITDNILNIQCGLGFVEGVKYQLTISAADLLTVTGYNLKEDLVIEFTYSAADEETTDDTESEETVVIHKSQLDETIERYHTPESITAKLLAILEEAQFNPGFTGNAILNRVSTDTEVTHWLRIQGSGYSGEKTPLGGNYWGTVNERAIGLQIIDYSDFVTYGRIMYAPYLTEAPENTFPFVTSVTILNEEGEEITVVGNETITVRITFNRDMDVTIPLNVRFGSAYPYGDYEISGEYVDARTWEGTYTLNTVIENGLQYWNIANGCSATEDLQLQPDTARFGFEIDTTAAQALLMQGYATETGVQLSWTQDDFDTLMGYNVYRSTSEDGLYVRLNSTVIPADTMSFFDDTVEPGVVYYYNFTVVKTDLTESDTSGKISIMSMDTMAPDIYHTPVSTAKTGSNLVISATVTDNLSIVYANVYYRITGAEEWNKAVMNCLNSRYSAIISAEHITVDGLEYYIEAFDGVSFTYKGTAENPYTVTVYEAVDTSSLGDVDGNGVVTAYDALLVLYARNDKYNLTAEQFFRADLNGDGELSAAEALRILQYVTGTVGSLIMN